MFEPSSQQAQGYASQPEAQEPKVLLNRYRIVKRCGSGGFASVMVCWDTRLERKVAIKCMPLATTAGIAASTLNEALSEARITSHLQHNNIVTVHDFEVRDNIAYLIMEYVDGFTLSDLLTRVEGGVLTYDECAHLLDSLSAALDFAHSKGVLHLDIKPGNVFIDTDGNIKLGDFGMASLASIAGLEGARGGTVGYMPPEQLQGYMVDERTDVFALAVVCYQALTGASPFLAADADASLKKIMKGARPLAKVEPELKGPVSDCIARAMSADATARQDSAGELARATLPYLGDEVDGKASIVSLMAQAKGETGPTDEEWIGANHIAFVESHPRAPEFCIRATSALVFGGIAARLSTGIAAAFSIQADQSAIIAAAFAALALIGAISPEAGGMLTGAVCVIALLCTGAYSPVFLIATLVAALLISWRWATAGSHRLSFAALFLPTALTCPLAAASLSGFSLTPLMATLTSGLGAALSLVMNQIGVGSGSAVSDACAATFGSPGTWVLIFGCAIGAGIASFFMGRMKVGTRIFGQVLACAVVIFFQLVSIRVENGGIWAAPDVFSVLVALTCLVLMSIAIWALGPEQLPQEDD